MHWHWIKHLNAFCQCSDHPNLSLVVRIKHLNAPSQCSRIFNPSKGSAQEEDIASFRFFYFFILGLILTMIGPHTWQYSLVQMSTVKLKQIYQLTCQIFKTKTAYQAHLLCFLSFQRQYHSFSRVLREALKKKSAKHFTHPPDPPPPPPPPLLWKKKK